MTFHGWVACRFVPLFHGDLYKSGMSRKKGDAFRCTGAGFRESDTFASQLHWDLQLQSGALEVLNRAVTLGFAMQIVCSEVRFCEKSRVKRSFWKLGVSLLVRVSWKLVFSSSVKVSWGMLVLGWFRKLVSWCPPRVSSKSVQQECLARVSCQECPAGVSSKSALSRVPCKKLLIVGDCASHLRKEKASIFISALVSVHSALHK